MAWAGGGTSGYRIVAVLHLVSALGEAGPEVGAEQQSQAGLHLGAKSYREDSTMVLANTSAHMVEGGPQDGYCQCLRPQGELQLPPASERLHDQLVGLT